MQPVTGRIPLLAPLNPSLSAAGPIEGLQAGALAGPLSGPQGAAETGGGFKDLLLESIGHVNSMQAHADQAVEQLMTGGDVNTAEVLTSLQKADMSFRMMLQIRNKLVEAYQQIQSVQI